MQPRRKASPTADIWSAVAEGDVEQITQLLDKGVSVNARQPGGGSTPLNMAAVFGQIDAAKLLIEKGADISQNSIGTGTFCAADWAVSDESSPWDW